ncbi:MAG: type II 3-dehydroquinate dehydratase [Pseudorhodoplanes sp.]
MSKILLLNGPNLNMLGTREPEIYGHDTLADIEVRVRKRAATHALDVDMRQSNHEGELVTFIQEAVKAKIAGIIINPAAYTHTSVAIVDALLQFSGPKIELHLSNPYAREAMRHKSLVSPVVTATIAGLGAQGYELAVDAMALLINANKIGKR